MTKLHAFSTFFDFTKSQRTAIWLLLTAIFLLQGICWYLYTLPVQGNQYAEWYYLKAPSNRSLESGSSQYPVYPFNPNFISDYKAYKLGLTAAELNRLRDYRKQNLYVNSAQEFQHITGVSDSVLQCIRPFFKFPDWVNKPKKNYEYKYKAQTNLVKQKIDINLATADDLKKIYGIGEGLSARIIQERQKWGGFVSMEQLKYIWGIQPEVAERLLVAFEVSHQPAITKIKINSCSLKELMQIPYVQYGLARSILAYRSRSNNPINIEDLLKIDQFPVDKINIIALYLEF